MLLLISILSFAAPYPEVFSSTGDAVYENAERYAKIISLDIYKERPELIEAYCMDANKTMQKGFSIDKMKEDPELIFDKQLIKSYVQELRELSNQSDNIISQLDEDIGYMIEKEDYKSLKIISDAGFGLSDSVMEAIKKTQEQTIVSTSVGKKIVVTPKVIKAPVVKIASSVEVIKVKPPVKVKKKDPTLLLYENSLKNLKEELYTLRELEDEDKMYCLNDITAINYWMLKVLNSSKDACLRADSIKQMKSYSKASANSCGRNSLRYNEWKGRIKPYVGKKLYEAEAGCNH